MATPRASGKKAPAKDRASRGPGKDPGRKPGQGKAARAKRAAGGPRPGAADGSAAKPASKPEAWVLRAAPGLGRTLHAELRDDRLIGRDARVDMLWQRNHDLLFAKRLAREPGPGDLRTAEDVLRCLIYGRFKISASQLDRLAQLLGRQPRRLAVTADGEHFNRHDLARFLTRELTRRGVRLDESAEASLVVFCVEQAYYACVPVRDADETAGRDRRTAEREGSLPPPIAAAMAFMTGPEDGDTILDPVCGSGTLLAEAGAYAPGARLTGVDQDPQAVKTARRNLQAHPTATIQPGDARALDMPEASVTLALANLPFGKQYGDVAENRTLYTELLTELRRVAAPAGFRAAVLVSDRALLRESARAAGFRVTRDTAVRVRGEDATIALLAPAGSDRARAATTN
jgi:predicted RNA methylase